MDTWDGTIQDLYQPVFIILLGLSFQVLMCRDIGVPGKDRILNSFFILIFIFIILLHTYDWKYIYIYKNLLILCAFAWLSVFH